MSLLLCGIAIAAGCAKEPPPRTVTEFMDNPMMLEAVMVRCAQNRNESRYDAECVNARQAASIIQAKEEREQRDAFEAQSDRKRQALRRTQQAAAEARRRASEAERLRKEAEYLAQFGELPPTSDGATGVVDPDANAPTVMMPDPVEAANETRATIESQPPSDGGNAPVADAPPPSSDLDAIREELRKRNAETGN